MQVAMSELTYAELPGPGTTLKRTYRLEDELGRGAFGVVYRAFHTGLEEYVAVKFVHPAALVDPRHKKRFEREVIVAKGLKHPNTVRILDSAETFDGVPYYVMELVEGVSLTELIATEGGLGYARVRRILVQILKALGEAHGKHVVHRDLKPENVRICDFHGDADFVKLLDFGIAAVRGSPDRITRSNGVVGTPTYMSPEQALGIAVDPRSDLYAVGLIGVECLTGEPVVLGSKLVEMLATHASPLELRLPPTLRASPLYYALRKATHKEPSERFQSAGEMIDALNQLGWLSDETCCDLDVDTTSAEYDLWTRPTDLHVVPDLPADEVDDTVPAEPGEPAARVDTDPFAAFRRPVVQPYHRSSVETAVDHEPPTSALESSPAPWIGLIIALIAALALFLALRGHADGAPLPGARAGVAVEQPASCTAAAPGPH